ncbi:MAG: zf-HC2 domain-containing protein [Planctomycetota bacterium]
MNRCDAVSEMLSGFIDDELTQSDFQRVEVHLRSCEQCRRTLEEMRQLRAAVRESQDDVRFPDEVWETLMNDLPAKTSRGIGWLLLISGTVSLTGLAAWEFFIESEEPIYVRLMVAAIFGGLLFLFLSVLRQRLVARKTDRYREVKY